MQYSMVDVRANCTIGKNARVRHFGNRARDHETRSLLYFLWFSEISQGIDWLASIPGPYDSHPDHDRLITSINIDRPMYLNQASYN